MKKLLYLFFTLLFLSCVPTSAHFDAPQIRRVGLMYEVKINNQTFYTYQISSEFQDMNRRY